MQFTLAEAGIDRKLAGGSGSITVSVSGYQMAKAQHFAPLAA
jgi:hypothetical protein